MRPELTLQETNGKSEKSYARGSVVDPDVQSVDDVTVFGAMWRYRVLVLLCTLAVLALAGLYGHSRPKQYVADASLIVQPVASGGSGTSDPGRYVADQVTLLQSPLLTRQAVDLANQLSTQSFTQHDFANSLRLESATSSDVITIHFTSSTARLAQVGANALGNAYMALARSSSTTQSPGSLLGGASPPAAVVPSAGSENLGATVGRATFLPADRPTGPASIGLPRLLAVAFAIGLLVSAALSYILAARSRKFRSGTGAEPVIRAPLLAEIPSFSKTSSLVPTQTDPGGHAAEAFRFAATTLATRTNGSPATTLLVVSPHHGDGRTTIAANLGIAAAHEGIRVLLVDADLNSQALSKLLSELSSRPVVRQPLFTDPESNTEKVISLDRDGLPLEPGEPLRQPHSPHAGSSAKIGLLTMGLLPSSYRSFRSEDAGKLFEAASLEYDLVLIDTAPLLTSADAAALSVHAHGSVVVVPAGARQADVSEVTERLALLECLPGGYFYNFGAAGLHRNGSSNGGRGAHARR